jgi:outer membrane protein assembly factor BamB
MKRIAAFCIIFLFISASEAGALRIRRSSYQNSVIGLDISMCDDDPMDSLWPMYCHDTRHTGRSPYSTADNPGTEKWRFDTIEVTWGSPVIDNDGVIYIGASHLFAVYPNGTLKWEYNEWIKTESAPAIDENGVLYVGSIWAHPNYLYAIYTSNGTLKWKYSVGDLIASSPAIGDDGTIYFGSEDDYIYALYSNGTLKWKYLTGVAVYSSPAIGLDGTVYCGSHDGNLYALYSNNGTLKWKYQTSDWVGRGPCIADDGTIYFGSWDGYLYAVYPDGSLKWKTGGNLASTTPVIAQDGTIYVGNRYLTAIYPTNGSVKWSFDPGSGRTIRGGNPCISAEGTIYFGTHIGETDGGELIAVNPDGTERWRIMLASSWIWSAPAIGEDGTVYVGSSNDVPPSESWGYLHAIGKLDVDAPSAPQINGETSGTIGKEYEYTFKSTSPLGRDVYYYIEWGDGTFKDWFGPHNSGEEVKVSHTWSSPGTYTIKARAKDTDNLWGPWGELTVTMPKNKAINFNSNSIKLLDHYSLLQKLLYL